jgi:phospholipid/cholesterol/gamma-HCH transport system ATP-binding protein
MQKRVAIARLIVNKPKYLFCDEPNSGLDPNTAILIDNLIKEITEEYDITTVINDMPNSVMEIESASCFLRWKSLGRNEEIFRTVNSCRLCLFF